MNKTYCRVKGYRCGVIKQLDKKLRVIIFHYDKSFPLKVECVDRFMYEAWVDISDVDCIWVEDGFDNIRVLKGELKVKKDEVPPIEDIHDTKYCKRHGYAMFNGKKYINYAGINNDFHYLLGSYNIDSQEDGFIMERPGWFMRKVPAEKIEYAFESYTWCIYNGLKFGVTESSGDYITIEPYSRYDYPDKVLEDLGFYIKNTKYTKVLHANELENIWVENKPHPNFKHLSFEPEILKGTIPQ